MALFGKVVRPLEDRALLQEGGPWGFSDSAPFSILSLIPEVQMPSLPCHEEQLLVVAVSGTS